MKPVIVFFDFDNTLTDFDVLDAVIRRFSVNEDWVTFEEAWQAGNIGSKECLEGQLQSLRLDQKVLSNYLKTIKLDPYFKKLLTLLNHEKIESMILSDSFSYFIHEILGHHQITGIPVYANELEFDYDRLIPSFPFQSPDCRRCAHCKKQHVLKAADKITVYIGDGLSDICPAEHADIVFAKGKLYEHFQKIGKPCKHFQSLQDIYLFSSYRSLHRRSKMLFE